MKTKDEDSRRISMTLRMPAWIHDRLSWQATMNGRTLSAEILARLERSADDMPRILPSPHLAAIHEKLGELDELLKEHEHNFRVGGKYIEALQAFIEDGGTKPARPRAGLDWLDHPETGAGWGKKNKSVKEAEATLVRVTEAAAANLDTSSQRAEENPKRIIERAAEEMSRLVDEAKKSAHEPESAPEAGPKK